MKPSEDKDAVEFSPGGNFVILCDSRGANEGDKELLDKELGIAVLDEPTEENTLERSVLESSKELLP